MVEGAPQLLIDLEQSAFAAAIRQSPWMYGAANVAHILGLMAFAAAVAILDLRYLGWFSAYRPMDIVAPARAAVLAALVVQVSSGFVLFAAEASHVALNPVFQVKLGLIGLALANGAWVTFAARRAIEETPTGAPLPARLRLAAAASLMLWLAVAAAGRLIAYV